MRSHRNATLTTHQAIAAPSTEEFNRAPAYIFPRLCNVQRASDVRATAAPPHPQRTVATKLLCKKLLKHLDPARAPALLASRS